MKCDQVFDILTRGSFPRGDSTDRQVESHLHACYECRQLAEALRPAVQLFHESLIHESMGGAAAEGLSSYQGCLPTQPASDLPTAVGLLIDCETRDLVVRRERSATMTEQLVATVFVVVAACSLVWFVAVGSNTDLGATGDNEPHVPALSEFVPLDPAQRVQLAALILPEACAAVLARGERVYDCCTRCHSASIVDRPKVQRVATVWVACSTCHPSRASNAAMRGDPRGPPSPAVGLTLMASADLAPIALSWAAGHSWSL
jgi:hypothetical protein